jgi:hypothetical protein
VVISPDRGDGARMSWIQVSDERDRPTLDVFRLRQPLHDERRVPRFHLSTGRAFRSLGELLRLPRARERSRLRRR